MARVYFTCKVTSGTVSVVKGDASYVVRPLAEFSGDSTDAIVVLNKTGADILIYSVADNTTAARRYAYASYT